jgi:hypothetical protein
MAHYAFLNDSNIVTEVITGKDENELIEGLSPEQWYGNYRAQTCIRTSYNGNIRYNFAGIGYTYDPIDDAFIAPMPECGHESLSLNSQKIWKCAQCEELLREAYSV